MQAFFDTEVLPDLLEKVLHIWLSGCCNNYREKLTCLLSCSNEGFKNYCNITTPGLTLFFIVSNSPS